MSIPPPVRSILAGFVLVAAVLLGDARNARACPTLPLHVAPGPAAAFEPPIDVGFPHVRATATPIELYRVSDPTGADWPVPDLRVSKHATPGAVLLEASPSCLEPEPWDAGATYLRDLHVSPAGTPGGDGSAGAPFDTIETAARVARPGDRILVHEGRYAGSSFVAGLQGLPDAPILVTGVPGEERPVLGSTAVGEALHLSEPAWVVLQDLVVEGPTANGVNIDDGGSFDTPAHHVILRRVSVRDVGVDGNQDCVKLSGLDDFLVTESSFERCGAGGSGVDMVGCHRGRIEASTFVDCGSSGVQAKGGSEDVVLHGNLFVDAGSRSMNLGGSTGLAYFRPQDADAEARRLVATANVVVGSDAPVAFVGCDACVVAGNTFWLPQVWAARILQESTDPRFVACRDGVFADNVIVFDDAVLRTEVNVGPDTAPGTFTFANNLWFARDDPTWPGPTLPVPESGGIVGLDPLLADPENGDFHPMSGSPVEGAGLCLPELVTDRDGRCHADPPDIGAHRAP